MDGLGLGALCLVAAEWMGLGWLSGVDWPDAEANANSSIFWAPRWALRLLVGSCITAFAQLVLAMTGLGFAMVPLVLVVASLGAGALRIVQRWTDPRTSPSGQPAAVMSWPERAGWLLLGLLLLSATARALLVPEAGWDAFSHWGLRAQAYALAGTIVDAHSEHEYYPPLVPLLEAWLYLHRGMAPVDLGKGVAGLIGSAFGVCLAWHLKLWLRPPWLAPWFAGAIVLATTALLESFWTGQADLALTTYFSLATLALLQWQRAPAAGWLIQAALFAAAASLTKLEGWPRIGIVGAVLILETLLVRPIAPARNVRAALVPVIAGGVAFLAWSAVAAARGITSNAEHLGQFQPLALGGVLVSLAAVFGGVRTGGGILVACLAWAVAGGCMFAGRLRPISLIVVGELAGTLAAFLLSSTSPEIEVRTSATRLFEQFLPLALFAGAVGLCKVRL